MPDIKLTKLEDGFYSYGTTPATEYWVERVATKEWDITYAEDSIVLFKGTSLVECRQWLARQGESDA